MLSSEKFLENSNPVLFTFLICSLLVILRRVLKVNIEAMSRYGLRPRAGEPRPVESDQDASIHRIEAFELPCHEQDTSPLFNGLPVEIRNIIYEYTLGDYEDLDHPYDLETCYRRPGYMGPRRTDTALVQTCQAIYNDAWYLPWTQSRHTFFLTARDRKPDKTTTIHRMTRTSKLIEKLHPDVPLYRKEVNNIQVFCQLYLLEPGTELNNILKVPHFYPRNVTITVRHTDFWNWESDTPIRISTPWVTKCKFPDSVTNLSIEFESLERRKPQVDHIANKAREDWHFTRNDGVHLVADTDTNSKSTLPAVRWKGSSTWNETRWVRDEDDREPGILSYYVVAISFKPASKTQDAAGYVIRNNRSKNNLIPDQIKVPDEIGSKTQIQGGSSKFHSIILQIVGADSSTPASEAARLVLDWQNNNTQVEQFTAIRLAREQVDRAAWRRIALSEIRT